MLRRLIAIPILVTAFGAVSAGASPASADLPPVPTHVAQISDDVAHPGSLTEWWYLEINDPHSKAGFVMAMNQFPLPIIDQLWIDKNGHKTLVIGPSLPVTASTSTPDVTSTAGRLVYDTASQRYHLTYNYGGLSADLWLNNPSPGVTFGPQQLSGAQNINWTNPVLDANVTGWIKPTLLSSPINVDGWRGYHDHNWGSFLFENPLWTGWEWAVAHNPDGSTDAMWTPENLDGSYQGVLVHTTPDHHTTFCSQDSQSLTNYTGLPFPYPVNVQAGCSSGAQLQQHWTVTSPEYAAVGVMLLNEGSGHGDDPNSVGFVEHARSLTTFGS